MIKLGRHISIAGSMEFAFDRAEDDGCSAMQIFVTNPRSWSMSAMDPGTAGKFSDRSERSSVSEVIAHMPYLPNLSSSDKRIYDRSIKSLKGNLERCDLLGISHLVTHMGSHMWMGTQKALSNISEALSQVADVAPGVMVLLENEAGHNNSVGADLKEMAEVRDRVGGERVGFCLDTCHAFAMGYDIGDADALERIDSEMGLDKIRAVHVNDAMMPLGSRRDRHANIGTGYIGIERFRKFFSHGDIRSKILILETPLSEKISEKEEIAEVRRLLS